MLEYGIAVILTPINRFNDYLRSRIAGVEPARQFEQQEHTNPQNEVVNGAYYHQEFKLDDRKMKDDGADWTEEIKAIKQQMREMNNRTDNLFRMIENSMLSNGRGKTNQDPSRSKTVNTRF